MSQGLERMEGRGGRTVVPVSKIFAITVGGKWRERVPEVASKHLN